MSITMVRRSCPGLTLMEIIVSMVIISLTFVGLASMFVMAKRHIMHSQLRMTSAAASRGFVDPLRIDVRQDQWGSNCLSSNGTMGCPANITIDGRNYNCTYSISDVPGTLLKRVVVTINWTESVP